MAYLVTFKVKGYGPFPVDMLRYDCCYPRSSESVSNMLTHRDMLRKDGADTKPQIVELSHLSLAKPALPKNVKGVWLGNICTPCVGRWASFGWQVIDVEMTKVPQ